MSNIRKIKLNRWSLADLRFHDLFFGQKRPKAWMNSLDGLRALAVIAVFLTHGMRLIEGTAEQSVLGVFWFDKLTHAWLGRGGVYLFFVLSSFLLTGQFLRESVNVKSPDIWINYALKRFLRIYPLYIFVMLVYLAGPSFKFGLFDLFQHLILREGRNHFWTIVVEFNYYLIFPMVAWLAVVILRRKLSHATMALMALIALAETYNIVFMPAGRLSVIPHVPVFLLGSLGAVVNLQLSRMSGDSKRRLMYPLEVLSILSFALIILTLPSQLSAGFWNWISGNDWASIAPNHWVFTFQALLWSVFLVAHLHGRGFCKQVLSHISLRFIGLISFGVYLWHIAVLGYLEAHLNVPGYINLVAVFIATVVLSSITYLLIEKPFSKLRLNVSLAAKSR